MKEKFKHYQKFTKEELEQISKNCVFVFDSNTLLNMYRYSRSTVDEFFKILNSFMMIFHIKISGANAT